MHAELLAQQQTAGFEHHYLLGNFGILSLGGSGSHQSKGLGALGSLGFSRQASPISYGVQATFSSQDYTQVGSVPGHPFPTSTVQSFVGLSTQNLGSITASFTNLHYGYNRLSALIDDFVLDNGLLIFPDQRIVTLSYNRQLFGKLYANVGAFKDLSGRNTQLFATVTLPLDSDKSLSLNANQQEGYHQENLQITKNLPLGNGYVYHAMASTNQAMEADVILQSQAGVYSARVDRYLEHTNVNLNARGSAAYFAGHAILSRPIEQSFALVDVPGFPGVDVYYRNQLMGHTNKAGYIYLPDLLPYQENEIHIDPLTLPINSSVGDLSQQVITYRKSGALVLFDVKRSHDILLTLKLDDGTLVPSGAVLKINHDEKASFPVGYNGQAYVTGNVLADISGEVTWDDGSCQFNLHLAPNDANLQKETVVCH